MLGHELRNPLGVISTCIQALKLKGPAENELVELRQMAERQVLHMSALLDDILDVSRIALGQIRIEKISCDLVSIVRRAAEDYGPTLGAAGLGLEVSAPKNPVWVMGDENRLAQCVSNLLHNAGKFSNSGGRVTVIVELLSDQQAALIRIRDDGVGIQPELLAEVFEPFRQAEQTLDRSLGGLGLGLTVVKGLVKLHGGQVWAISNGIGKGSEFCIQLPLSSGAGSAKVVREFVSKTIPCHILLIDDNPHALRAFKLLLEMRGHKVEVAQSGSDGVALAKKLHPQLIICDIGLPDMDGYAVVQALRQDAELNDICIVAASGYGQDEDRRRARTVGFNEYFVKPIDLGKLERVISQLTD